MLGLISYGVILLLLIGLSLKRPAYGYAAFLCIFGLEQWGQIYVPLLRQLSFLSNILVLIPIWVSCALRFDRVFLKGDWKGASQRTWIALLYMFAAISLLWTPEDAGAEAKWLASLPYLLTGVLVLPLCLRSTHDFIAAQKIFIYVGALLMLLLAFVPQWGARSIIIGSRESIGLPLALGELAGYVLITASLYLRKSLLSWALFGLAVVGTLTVAIKSGSRGPLIFSILAIFIAMPLAWRGGFLRKYSGIVFFGLVFAAAIFEIFSSASAYNDRWEAGRIVADSTSRIDAGLILLGESLSSPLSIIFGLGNSASFSGSLLGMYPHMVPLEVLAEEGLVGFGMWLLIFFVALTQLRLIRKPMFQHSEAKKAFLTIFACLIFSTLLSFKQGSLISFSIPFVFVALQERLIALRKYNR
jgi:hypothetical protein